MLGCVWEYNIKQLLNDHEVEQDMRIIKAEVCVITQTEALVIPHILREPNSIIVLLFIKRSPNLSFEETICVFSVLTKPA